MIYNIISTTDNLNEIGCYPQVKEGKRHDYGAIESYWNVSWENFPNFVPKYQLEILEKAKRTNFLNNLSGFYGFTIDLEFKKILERHKLPPCNFYPVEVIYRNKNYNYYWFHFINSILPYIDFEKSSFEIFRTNPFKIFEERPLISIDNIHKVSDKLSFEKSVRIKEIVLKNNFPFFDVISLWNITPLILISDKLKNELIKAGINGFETSVFDKIKFS